MLGAIVGDIIGSVYEGGQAERLDFPLFAPGCRFTDDSVLTIAVADAILSKASYGEKIKEYYRLYPEAGYGGRFIAWGESDSYQPYHSFGNGSAMRVSPVAYACDDLETVLEQAKLTAECTHNHPEGIKGAQAIAAAIFWARIGYPRETIRHEIIARFGYDLSNNIHVLHRQGRFDVTCQGSVPQAIIAFLESNNFEEAIRNAVYIGGDSDTIACMAGAIAEAYYGSIPAPVLEIIFKKLDAHLGEVVRQFMQVYAPDRTPENFQQRSNQISRRVLKQISPKVGLRIIPEKMLTQTLGPEERLYVCVGDQDEFINREISTVACALYGHFDQQSVKVKDLFGTWVNTDVGMCGQTDSFDAIESEFYYVVKIDLENFSDVDWFPGTWKALAYILSDPIRMLPKIGLYKEFMEIVKGTQPFRNNQKGSIDFYELADIEAGYNSRQQGYYNYITSDSLFGDTLVSLFGINNRCWHGCGYIGTRNSIAGRVFLIKNIALTHPAVLSCRKMKRDERLE